ncbi:DUF7675 family protein [Finegoldia magna]|uniref:DUF7675 family protein n=1 Tax=Finegoldia magna TaxID=1260 RepID=UPI000763E24C|nr:hypothetical protein [Finegoldia magna]KXA10061.1 hypothetical protein HMPREF3217_00563 [Finegoldia magna]
MQNKWYKNKETDLIWWKESDKIGVWEFSFDKIKIFNMFRDYPHELSDEEKDIFDRENPYWKDFFKEREMGL